MSVVVIPYLNSSDAKHQNKFMLYQSNQELPLEIRSCLSEAAQDLYRAAYNCAIHWYGEPTKSSPSCC